MDDSDEIINFASEEDDDEDEDNNISDYDDDKESLESSDILSNKQSDYKIESASINVDEQVSSSKQLSSKIITIKKRYTRRISLFEITGIIAESYNLLQRGRLPLVSNLTDETIKQNMLHVVIDEIKEGTCPIIIEKNGELLSINDFDKIGIKTHLDYIINIWKQQGRY
ncbi:RNA polymerase subunit rpo19 [Tanapox virus]|uniref:DNA-directed RNA polymerase 19 kDa subunit n=1 Tax=Tanapox virus TaxID=99000 RepID=A7XCM4_9POXV|nr:RNA polymerase subunit rpo19 [Tanapox virus]ABQ43726.1 RNA polymerase subunit rpo19 [Tanapox virus]